ncbi:MAG TPA: ATPase, T2SS/T4P/T4SS family [Alphaproteobacteria bacterium]|nr:ATPase, T2SS/T4P/T4SS family [Alphaproteobacteria bacterium]
MASNLRLVADETPGETPAVADTLGARLVELGLVTPDQLRIALHEQRRGGHMLGLTLVELGFLGEDDLAGVLAERTGRRRIDLRKTPPDPDLMEKVPEAVARRCRAVPARLKGDTLELAMADPYDVTAIDEMRRYFPRRVEIVPLVAAAADIMALLDHADRAAASINDILKELETGESAEGEEAWQHPVVRLVNTLLADAARRGASDLHFEPENSFVRLRYRIDGVLTQVRAIHRTHWPELSHRLKIMGGLNIADQRSLQDGRFRLSINGAEIDFRIAVMPTVQGENITVRVLDHRRALVPLEQLGFGGAALKELGRMLERPEGIVLVTGPTGCGKTTTLYSMLAKISTVEVNIMTLEEPVEYQLSLIRQTAVAEAQGLTFAEGVRGILRQDPDIIFIGEVRDPDTAQMALRAAMTGHQVFSTLHCNDAAGALPRLYDLGLGPRALQGNLSGIVGQRLVRCLCPHCKRPRAANEEEQKILSTFAPNTGIETPASATHRAPGFAETQSAYLGPAPAAPVIYEAVGCAQCNGSGHKGRIAVAEVLRIAPALDELIARDAGRGEIMQAARGEGFRGMAEDGMQKVLAGTIALDSLRRAIDVTGIG